MRLIEQLLDLENIAASPNPGWRSQGTSLGTGALPKPDADKAFETWLNNIGRKPTAKDREAWGVEAQRQGIDLPDEERVWNALGTRSEALGGPGGWAGFNLPTPGMGGFAKRQVQPVDYEQPEDMNQPLPKRKAMPDDPQGLHLPKTAKLMRQEADMFAFPGFVRTPQGGGMSNAAAAEMGQPGEPQQPQQGAAPGFPFHTKVAERIWTFAQLIIVTHPEAPPYDILRMSMGQAGSDATEVTPEDMTLLMMAIDWLQNGPAGVKPRTGGTPGGPLSTAPNANHGESVEVRTDADVREDAFSAWSYAGPEPGASFASMSTTGPAAMTFPSRIPNNAGGLPMDFYPRPDKKEKEKKKAETKREALRKLSLWVAQRPTS